jgi:methyl-accepting chemotaxis protein
MPAMLTAARSLLVVALIGVWVAALGGAWIGSRSGAEEVLRDERELFGTLIRIRRAQLAAYFATTIEESRFWARNRITRQALREFSSAWSELGGAATETLQRLYIDQNPYPTGERDNLERADDDSTYSQVHAQYHYWLRSFLLHRGIYDVFLFDPAGNLVYSSFKEPEFATNLVDGPFRDTDLARAFLEARDNPYPSYVAVYDFAPHAPSDGAPAMFTASPVLADDGTFLGVMAFQLAAERINTIVREVGLRKTGKTYLVGPDLRLRSRTRFSETADMLETKVDAETARAALAGEEGQRLATDYRGARVLSSYAPLDIGSRLRWGLLAELDEDEYLAPARAIRNQALAIGTGLAAGLSIILLVWARLGARSPA